MICLTGMTVTAKGTIHFGVKSSTNDTITTSATLDNGFEMDADDQNQI